LSQNPKSVDICLITPENALEPIVREAPVDIPSDQWHQWKSVVKDNGDK